MFAHPASHTLHEHCSYQAPHGLILSEIMLSCRTSLGASVLHGAAHESCTHREVNELNKLCTWRASVL